MKNLTERDITIIMLIATGANLILGLVIMPDASPALQYACLGAGVLLSALAVILVFRAHSEVAIFHQTSDVVVVPAHLSQYVYTPIDLPPLADAVESELWH